MNKQRNQKKILIFRFKKSKIISSHGISVRKHCMITWWTREKIHGSNGRKCIEFTVRAVQKLRQHPILRALPLPPPHLSATRPKWSDILGFKPRPLILGRQLFPTLPPSPSPLANVIFGWPLIRCVVPDFFTVTRVFDWCGCGCGCGCVGVFFCRTAGWFSSRSSFIRPFSALPCPFRGSSNSKCSPWGAAWHGHALNGTCWRCQGNRLTSARRIPRTLCSCRWWSFLSSSSRTPGRLVSAKKSFFQSYCTVAIRWTD